VPNCPYIWNWTGPLEDAPVDWGSYSSAILESPTATRILSDLAPPHFNLIDYHTGVLFGPEAELRWRKRRFGGFHVVGINHLPTQAWDGSTTRDLVLVDAADSGLPTQLLLWGTPHTSGWSDSRLTAPLEYPPHLQGSRVAIQLEHLLMPSSVRLPGTPEESVLLPLVRFVRLIAAQQEPL